MEVVRSLMLEESMSPMTTVCMVTGGKCKSERCSSLVVKHRELCDVTQVTRGGTSAPGINTYHASGDKGHYFCIPI